MEKLTFNKNGQWSLVKGGDKCEWIKADGDQCADDGEGDHHGEWLCKKHLKLRQQGKSSGWEGSKTVSELDDKNVKSAKALDLKETKYKTFH